VLRQLVILKQAADLCSSALNQYLILELLKADVLESYVEKVKTVYGQKEETMAAALQTGLGHTSASWNEPEGGMFFWVKLPEGLDSSALLSEALKAGVAYVKGSAFYTDKTSGQDCLRLNFSNPSLEQIQQGIGRLSSIVEAHLKIAVPG
jgi:DNA-binding transcriptional MocR family regulator